MTYKNSRFKTILAYEAKVLTAYKYQLELQNELLKKIKSVLPDNLSAHALYCVISEKKILLYTDAAVWSSQLRFYHQIMLKALVSSDWSSITILQVKIIPKSIQQETNKLLKLPSAKSIDLILEQAENQPNEILKSALLKLGKTIKRKAGLGTLKE